MILPPVWRKLLLVAHVVTSVGFVGAVAGFLALSLTGLWTADETLASAVYRAMAVLTSMVILPVAVLSLLIGVVQSLGTPWGLFRYYWVIFKLVLTAAALGVLLLQLETIETLAEAARSGQLAGYFAARVSTAFHATGGLAVLLTATVLSVYKPRGVTGYGARAIAAGRGTEPSTSG